VKTEIAALHEKHPGYHMTNYVMGVYVGLVENNPAGSIPFFRETVRILPTFADAHYNLGSACFTTCRAGEAVAAFREAIRYSNGEDGLDKMAQQRIDELESIVTRDSPFKTIDAFIENEELFDLAFEHLRNKHCFEAAQMFEKVLKQNPRHVQSRGNLALCYAGMGRKAGALACLEWALRLDPTYEPARTNRTILERMTEGKPFVPEEMAETEYYRERLRSDTAARTPADS
jgi:tetratricopeptide (TPR) repeat protein